MTTLNNDMRRVAGLALRDVPHRFARQARKSIGLAIVFALIALAGMLPGITHARTAGTPISGTLTIVNNSPGDQSDPHISGALVAYTSAVGGFSEIRYHNLLTGADLSIPTNGGLDLLADVSGATIVYTHLSAGRSAIYAFDTSTAGPPVELDPQPASNRREPAIGNRTVAWVDGGFFASPEYTEIVAYDRTTQTATRHTDDLAHDTVPAVSPDGSVIVWAKCQTIGSPCHIWQATRSSSGWTTTQLTGAAGDEFNSATSGQVVVYDSGWSAEEVGIFWQPVGGGVEQHLALPGPDRNPNVSGNLVTFEHLDLVTGNFDIYLYNLTTGTLYQLTDSPADEILSDIVVAPDGQIRVVWTAQEANSNVYALTFRLPAADRTPPNITIGAPANTTYTLNQVLTASYNCADESGGSGLASCVGPVASGSPIHTASVGAKTFTVHAADNAGNTASQSVTYTVAYGICALYDQSKAHRLGSTVPIKLQLCDASGANVSSSSIIVHATGLTKLDGTASGDMEDPGNANPDHDFRYDATLGGTGGYIYNLSTTNLSTGTWALSFTAADDPVTHTVRFDVR